MKRIKSQKPLKSPRYYLQFKLMNITTHTSTPISIKFILYKGVQKLDQTKDYIHCQNSKTDLHQQLNSSLNFYVDIQQAKRISQYRIIIQNRQQQKIGQTNINIFPMIQDFLNKGVNTFNKTMKVQNIVSFEILTILEKTKYNLTKSVQLLSQTKSNNKFKSQPNKSVTYSTRQNIIIHNQKSNKIRKISNDLITVDLSKTSEFIQQSYQNNNSIVFQNQQNYETQQKIKCENKQIQKQIPQLIYDFDSISMIGSSMTKQSSFSTRFIFVSLILLLFAISYFIVIVQDQKSQLSIISRKLINVFRNQLQN